MWGVACVSCVSRAVCRASSLFLNCMIHIGLTTHSVPVLCTRTNLLAASLLKLRLLAFTTPSSCTVHVCVFERPRRCCCCVWWWLL